MLSLEYVAGFIDGEGGFGIYDGQQRMTISNTNREVLVQISEVIGGGRIATRPATDRWKESHELQIGSLLMREFLPRVIPYLIVKREAAELMVEYLSPIVSRGGFGVPLPDELERARRSRLRNRMRAINGSSAVAFGHARGV